MLHNTAVKSSAWVAALVLSAAIHGALMMMTVPAIASAYAASKHIALDKNAMQVILSFAIGWCVVISIWCAMVTNVLSRADNRWGGIKGLRLLGIVAGLTLALDLVNGPCLWTCPPIALVVPILSYVAISNNSVPFEEKTEDPPAHG